MRRGVLDYDRRHGYRGPEAYVEPARRPGRARSRCSSGSSQEAPDGDDLVAAVVLEAAAGEVKAVLADGDVVAITGDGLKFAARALGDKVAGERSASAAARSSGCREDDKGRWAIAQLPQVEAAFVSLAPAATARSSRWSAASTSSATSSTT